MSNIFFNFFKKDSPPENYLSLILIPGKVLASVWTFSHDTVQFLGFATKSYQNFDNLLHQAAIAIDTACQKAQSDVKKTVFGLAANWFENDKLSDHTTKILKSLSDDLELDPQAYILLAAAINHLLKIEESITPSVVLVGIFSQPEPFSEAHLLENNKIVATNTSRTSPTLDKIKQLIESLKPEDKDLPSRIILYGDNLEFISQLEKANLGDLFLHEPKIDILSDQDLAKSVAYAQAEDILGREPVSYPKPQVLHQESTFGFVEGVDILESQNQAKTPPQQPEEKPEAPLKSPTEPKESIHQPPQTPAETPPGPLAKILNFLKFRPSLKIIALVMALLTATTVAATYFVDQTASVEVTIKVNSQHQELDFQSQIPGQEVSANASGSQKAVATGSQQIGEYAKGEITIFNWTKEPKTFGSGIVVITKNGFKFALQSDIDVASRSASTPGQTKAALIASAFGPDSNIEANQEFTFQEYDELLYSARNDSSFTGGSQKQVTVVAATDLQRLEKSLTDSLVEKAKNSLREKVSGSKLHDNTIAIKITSKAFDKKLDEEASLINLDMQVEANAIVYSTEDLKGLLSQTIKDIPQNRKIRKEDIEIIETSAKRSDSPGQNILILSGAFRAKLIPKIEEDDLKNQIIGKNIKVARAIIRSLPDIADVQFNFSPNVPLIDFMPKDKSKIKIKIEAS